MSSLNKICGCGAPIALHNSNRGITECHECQAKARKFLEDILHSDSVEDWQAKLKQSPEVASWAIRQLNDAIDKEEENQNEASR
jgi:hypothetical protein